MILNAFQQTLRDLVIPYYAEPHRFYHTMEHIDAMMAQYEAVFGPITIAEYVAVLYHDIVYIPGSKTNEDDSITLMYTHRPVFYNAVSNDLLESAKQIILDTKHNAAPSLSSTRVVDLDLMILGRDPNVYSTYIQNVRKEFAAVSDDQWKAGRSAFLQSMIALPSIFRTPQMIALYEQQAQYNLADELKALS